MLLFKLFSGEFAGAEIELGINQEISCGNLSDTDIYLSTEGEEEFCFSFTADEHDIIRFLNIGNTKLQAGNDSLVEVNQPLKAPLFLIANGTKFAIGASDDLAQWIEPVNKSETPIADIGQEDNLSDDIIQLLARDTKINSKPQKMIAWLTKLHPVTLSKRISWLVTNKLLPKLTLVYQTNKIKFYSLCTVFILTLLIIISLGVILSKSEVNIEKPSNNISLVKKRFNELPPKYANLNLRNLGNGKYKIVGMVTSNEDLASLKGFFKTYQDNTSFSVLTFDLVRAKIKTVLANHGMSNASILYDNTTQAIIVAGIVNVPDEEVSNMQLDISSQLPDIENINFKIFTADQLQQDIKSNLGEFTNILSINNDYNSNQITITGYLTQLQMDACNKGIQNLQKKYYDVIDIKADIKNSLSALPFKIYAIYTGEQAYIITDQGEYIFVGGKIKDFKLVELNSSKIVLANKQFTIEVPVSQLENTNDKSHHLADQDDSRLAVLNDELGRVESAIVSEQYQLTRLQRYKEKVTESETASFTQQEIDNITTDLEQKKKDVEYLKQLVSK